MGFAQARAPGWEEAMEAHGVCWAGARVRARPAVSTAKPAAIRQTYRSLGAAGEPKMSSVSIYL